MPPWQSPQWAMTGLLPGTQAPKVSEERRQSGGPGGERPEVQRWTLQVTRKPRRRRDLTVPTHSRFAGVTSALGVIAVVR